MNRSLLTRVGQALYGPHWQTHLAEALGVTRRTVVRWVAGDTRPQHMDEHVAKLLRQRAAEIERLLAALEG